MLAIANGEGECIQTLLSVTSQEHLVGHCAKKDAGLDGPCSGYRELDGFNLLAPAVLLLAVGL